MRPPLIAWLIADVSQKMKPIVFLVSLAVSALPLAAQLVESKAERSKNGGNYFDTEVKRGDAVVYRQSRFVSPDEQANSTREQFFVGGRLACELLRLKGRSTFRSLGLSAVSIYHRKVEGESEILTLIDTTHELAQSFLKKGDHFVPQLRAEDVREEEG